MYRLLYLLLLLPLCYGCPPPPETPTLATNNVEIRNDEPATYERYRLEDVRRPDTFAFVRDLASPLDYLPDTVNPSLLPFRYLNTSYHIMNTTDTIFPFVGEEGQKKVADMLVQMSSLMRRTPELWLKPDSTDVPALPRRMRFNFARKPGTDEFAIYENYDDELYWYLHKGRKRNRGDRAVITKYAINPDSVLNIFIMGPPRDSLKSKRFRTNGTDGIYLGNAIKVTGWMESNRPPWEVARIVAHEIGHALGLLHAWRKDGCDDTPTHGNKAWSMARGTTGPGRSSNNLMDYSDSMEALTPCQIGRMHQRMSDVTSRQRGWLVRNWCENQKGAAVRIRRDVILDGARDFGSTIILERGSSLTINNRLHLPEGAVIKVTPGATLTLGPKAIIHNDCGGQWGGILVGSTESGISGRVIADPEAVILNEAS